MSTFSAEANVSDTHHYLCPSCGQWNRVPASRAAEGPQCGRCGAALPSEAAPVELDARTFDVVTARAPVPVLVDLWAPWCGPCRAMAPVLAELARRRKGEVLVTKLNTDENGQVAQRLQVQGIPTLLLYRNGALVQRATGAMPLAQLEQWLAASGA